MCFNRQGGRLLNNEGSEFRGVGRVWAGSNPLTRYRLFARPNKVMLRNVVAALMLLATAVLPGRAVAHQAQGQQADPPQVQKNQDPKHAADIKRDEDMGKQYSTEADKELKASKNQQMVDRVSRVGGEIAKVARATQVKVLWGDGRLNPFDYKFKVVEGKDVNAFSLPGGYIYIFEGLMNYVESDDELAGVLAHEIAHASGRHLSTMIREQSKFDLLTLPLILVTILSGSHDVGLLVLRDLANVAGRSGWSQKAETAADYASFQYLQHTNYNSLGLLTFMERLARDQKGVESVDWGILRTHPPTRERAEKITSYLTAAHIPIKRSLVTTSFRVTTKNADKGGIELHFNSRLLVTFNGAGAEQRAKDAELRLNDFFDSVPDLFEVRADGDGTIIGRKSILLRVTSEDAEASKVTVDQLTTQTLSAIKRSIYMLAFHIWDAR